MHVAESDQQARAEAEPQLLKGFFGNDAAMKKIAATRVGFGGDPRMTGGERTPDIEERGRVFGELMKSYDFWIDSGLALVGSPETVIRQLRDQQARLRLRHLSGPAPAGGPVTRPDVEVAGAVWEGGRARLPLRSDAAGHPRRSTFRATPHDRAWRL